MSTPSGGVVVVYRMTGGIDAIDEYSRRLVGALEAGGIEACYEPNGLSSALAAAFAPSWILLQYNPFSYGRWGFAPALVRDALRLKRRAGLSLAIMVHEAWLPMNGWRWTLMGLWQRAQLRALLRLVDAVTTSTEALAREIGHGAVHVPIGTNITPIPTSHQAARDGLGLNGKLAIALFGRAHPTRALDHAEAAIAALAGVHGANRLAVLNLGADAAALRVPPGVEVFTPGALGADQLSLRLTASDVVLLPLTDGVSTRRTTLMAALAHGRPLVGLRGSNTDGLLTGARDALALTPTGDPAAFSRAAVELTADRARLEAMGDAGRRLYEQRFDWPVIARSVASVLDTTSASPRRDARRRSAAQSAGTSGRPREVVFVALDVGGSGGMERQSEQLVNQLLAAAGQRVTVIARSCALQEHEGLRFRRVRVPRRPATLANPAFFVIASLLLARRGGALLHTTGAIVANRADVSTVHYCHRAAAEQVAGSRASRPGPLYRINAAVHARLSLAAEAWCYRPRRAGLLCAVSEGVAGELRTRFPAMAGAVRTVPNGVDPVCFRPDPAARREVRAELGLDDRTSLALFVGGDWQRKGLAHAVDALALAPDWHLAVAGAGNPEPLQARARTAGTQSRLRFLGAVHDMPRLYAAGDAFVLPTSYETFSLVTFEAAASGLPLLVTRVSGVEDLLQDGSNGWFIEQDGRDIARRLEQLRSDPELARAMADSARAAATGYPWEAMADGYRALYAELADP